MGLRQETFIDLFCGAGLLRYGMERAGLRCVLASEWDDHAAAVYRRNYNDDTLIQDDIRNLRADDIPDADWLVAGFPCQPFSICGQERGFDDTRGTLFFEIARILQHKKPRGVLLENVRRLLEHDGGRTFIRIIGVLENLGYAVEWAVLNAAFYGLPQNRSRLFIIGRARSEPRGALFLQPESPRAYHEVDPQSVATCLDASYHKGWLDHGQRTFVFQHGHPRRLTPVECERLMGLPDGYTARGLTSEGRTILISDTQRYRMIGNGVACPVVTDIFRATREQDSMFTVLDPDRVIWGDLFELMQTSDNGTQYLLGRSDRNYSCQVQPDRGPVYFARRDRPEGYRVPWKNAESAFVLNESLEDLWAFLCLNFPQMKVAA